MSDELYLAAARCEPLRVYGSSRCTCGSTVRDTKMAVQAGLRVVRIRYGLPYSELPDSFEDRLDSLLLYLLAQGKVRASVSFPRRQGLPDGDGLVRLVRLGRKERWELAHSLNSFKRNLPTGCRLHTPRRGPAWEQVAFSKPPPTSPEYLAFVRAEVSRLFPSGWDRSYFSDCRSFLPRASAREDHPNFKRGDASGIWSEIGREEFLSRCTEEGRCSDDLSCRYKEVLSAGKVRPLTIFDHRIDELGPLNKTLYDYLTRKPWLLRGSPTEERMEKICVNKFQTSVDLVAATDGLRHDVAKEILRSLFFGSIAVPRSLRRLAVRSLEPLVHLASLRGDNFTGKYKRVTNGQMMGAYLSFPLLCLQSYCAARWASRDCPEASYLVNGDDCVISANREVVPSDYPDFCVLNDKKTIRAENVVEVNSTVFLRVGKRWRRVDHLRRGTLLPGYAGALHLAKACAPSSRWTEAYVKSRLSRKWGFLPSQLGLNRKSRAAWRREVSMTRTRLFSELPCPVDPVDESIEIRRGETPDPDESEALVNHVFSHGRVVGSREVHNPAIGVVRRSYRYRVLPRWKTFSFGCWSSHEAPVAASSSPFLKDYESDRYKGRLLALGVYNRLVGL